MEKSNEPFLLEPVGKDYIWGGERLKKEFNKKIDLTPLAETWECSVHPDGQSVIATGKYSGEKLSSILKLHPEYLGDNVNTNGELPILVKLIDAKNDLSVQVHPSDEYANKYENGQSGKTEMWYVIGSNPDATLVYGFKKDMKKDEVRRAIEDGSIENFLNKVPVDKHDVFLIEAGTVHAIGAGTLIAEIQENSNLTYRMYDYNRIDKNGNKRELHIDKALDVMNLNKAERVIHEKIPYIKENGMETKEICKCQYFDVYKDKLDSIEGIELKNDNKSFRVFLCIEGNGKILYNDDSIMFYKGDCIFIPANSVQMKISGNAEILNINC